MLIVRLAGNIMQDLILNVKNISKIYGSKENTCRALNEVSLVVSRGEFVGVMGASGSGKSTLLNCISTIDKPTQGEIIVESQEITKLRGKKLEEFRRDKLGFIFQDFNLLDTLTAFENIALPLSISKVRVEELKKRVHKIAEQLNIQGILEKFPYQMSGGQRQRVAAARAIISNPAVILADEPTGALDSGSASMILDLMSELNKKLNATILMVTHDAYTASYCDRILFLKDGRVVREIEKGNKERKELYMETINTVTELGGGSSHVL